jgi:hypothetical protein
MNWQRRTDKCSRKNDNQELQNPKPPLTCSHKASEELAARRTFQQLEEETQQEKKIAQEKS